MNCLALILAAYKFKIQFDNSYSLLQKYLTNCVKEEETVLCKTVESDNDNTRDSALCKYSATNDLCSQNQICDETVIPTDEINITKCYRRQSSSRMSRKLGKLKQG